MKKIILIEDHQMVKAMYQAIIIARLLEIPPNKLLHLDLKQQETYKSQLNREKEIDIEVLSSVEEILEKYGSGMPEDAVIIMDGQLRSPGKTTSRQTVEIFTLFSEKAKKMTIPMSSDSVSIELAEKNGFPKGIEKKDIGITGIFTDRIIEKLNELS